MKKPLAVALLAASFSLGGCAASTHAIQPSSLGASHRSADLLAVVDQPGPIEAETVVSCDWAIPLSGLLNLDSPKAQAAGKKYEPVTYEGAGHGFMRAGEDPTDTVPGNKTAREQGFGRLVKLLREMKGAQTATAGPAQRIDAPAHALRCHEDSAAQVAASM